MQQHQPKHPESAPLSPGEYLHWLEEALRVCQWLDGLCLAAAQMRRCRWWRLGGGLGMVQTGAKGPLEQVAQWRDGALELQRELLAALEAGSLGHEAARVGLARLTELVPAVHREILRGAGSVWWRGGLALGLVRARAARATETAAEVMAQFRRFKAMPPLFPPMEQALPAPLSSPKPWHNSQFHQKVQPWTHSGQWPVLDAAFRISEQRLAGECAAPLPAAPPMVTVIMATRNCADTIAQRVRSVMDQTWPHWELIVCDDGSWDGTADAACAAGDGRVRALRLAPGGTAPARNRGLVEARGSYVAYLDAGTLWHPAYLESMVRALEARPGRWCAFARPIEADTLGGDTVGLRSGRAETFVHDRLAEKSFVRLGAFFHRTELARLFGGFSESGTQDQDWALTVKYTFAQQPVRVDRFLVLHENGDPGASTNETGESAVAQTVRECYAEGLAGPNRGARRRVTVICCDVRPDDVRRARQLSAALRGAGFDVQEHRIAVPPPGTPWQAGNHLAKVTGGLVLCVGALPRTLEVGLAAAAEHGEGFVLDLTAADVDEHGAIAPAAALIPLWTTGNPRVDTLLDGRAMFLGGYEGDHFVADTPGSRRMFWAGRTDAAARPTPAELALRVDLPEHALTESVSDAWSAALFWPVSLPVPDYGLDPFALARAFALRMPVILGDPAGPDDTVRQGAARWVNPEDDEALRDAIDEALERRGPARERAENARRLFLRQYGARAAAAQFAVVWERAMAAAPQGGRTAPRSR